MLHHPWEISLREYILSTTSISIICLPQTCSLLPHELPHNLIPSHCGSIETSSGHYTMLSGNKKFKKVARKRLGLCILNLIIR